MKFRPNNGDSIFDYFLENLLSALFLSQVLQLCPLIDTARLYLDVFLKFGGRADDLNGDEFVYNVLLGRYFFICCMLLNISYHL